MSSTKPIIGISTNEIINFGGRQVSHSTGLRYVNAVSKFSNAIPILIPSYIKGKDLDLLLKKVDGIVLTGGRANVEPHHFGGDPFPPDEPIDVGRDEIVLEMIPKCVSLGIPIFGICRGIQEINVAYGGTLHYRVHLLDEKNDTIGGQENAAGGLAFHSQMPVIGGLDQRQIKKVSLMDLKAKINEKFRDKVSELEQMEEVEDEDEISKLVEKAKSYA